MPYTNPGSLSKSSGPGFNLCIIRAPIKTAVDALPGMPSVRSGTNAPPTDPLFAASGAATPSNDPFPNFSGCLLEFLALS